MSSRAVRRALRSQEAQLASPPSPGQLASPKKSASPFDALAGDEESSERDNSEDEEERKEEVEAYSRPKHSLFALLGGDEDDEDVDKDDAYQLSAGVEIKEKLSKDEEGDVQQLLPKSERSSSKKKSSKKKSKKKIAKVTANKAKQKDENFDEIDQALAELNMKPGIPLADAQAVVISKTQTDGKSSAQALARLLSVNVRNLDPGREMRKLFGRHVFEGEAREVRRGGQRGLARPIASRRYVLVQPADDWPPLIGASGMTMEVVGTEGEITSFKFTHNRAYMDIQRQFYMCLQLGDAELLTELLQHNLYHVSTLLQVSEILTHHGEHTNAAKTVERALFTYNKSFHPMFNVSTGRVRLPFKYYENRGFYLSIYRHVRNLERKGTWSTAFEFLKLLLEVSAEEDPYCVLLMIDIYALHSGNDQFIIDLATSHIFEDRVPDLPNIAFSLALAYFHTSNFSAAESALETAASTFPWTLSALGFALGLDVPPQLMNFNEPPSSFQQIVTQLYLSRASSLWSSTQTKGLLDNAIAKMKQTPPSPPVRVIDPRYPVSRDLARHCMLSDIKPVLELLPRECVEGEEIWTDDMLPPRDNISPYANNPPSRSTGRTSASNRDGNDGNMGVDDRGILDGLWNSILQWRRGRRQNGPEDDEDEFNSEDEEIAWALANEAINAANVANVANVASAEPAEEEEDEVAAAAAGERRRQAGQSYISSLLRRLAGGLGIGGSPDAVIDDADNYFEGEEGAGDEEYLNAEEEPYDEDDAVDEDTDTDGEYP
ncbi:transcriptional repressor TCF25-domain-containing protein [Lipomyces chichibuensis]|uniref:transcriptional repressor TCF25-domain-containing protein n=1 Tax=Lipomyces chichibuensis TaxID=1546026 RepID=UPI0033432EDD